MDGYKVVSADDKEVGEVVGRLGDSVVVEHGLLRKKKHAVPLAFASADDDARSSGRRSKEMIESSPEVHDLDVDDPDRHLLRPRGAGGGRRHGGRGLTRPRSRPKRSARHPRGDLVGRGPLDRGESPGTGGDRYRDAER